MSQTYFAILTAVGEAKLANAAALGTQLQVSRMAVGDGGGTLPTPNRSQTALVGEKYRGDLNSLNVDPGNASQIIAEMVIPESEGGYWLREMGIFDAADNLIAVSNCPPSYKPQMAEGSGRTQVLRMVLIVSSTGAVQLKVDPSVVLATRKSVQDELDKLKNKVVPAEGAELVGYKDRTVRERLSEHPTPKDFKAKGDGATNDTAAFTSLEASHKGRQVDLCGATYVVDAIPKKNAYFNGTFKHAGYSRPAALFDTFAGLSPKFHLFGDQLARLKTALLDPLVQKVGIVFIGDSITWGSGTGESMPTDPRDGTLSDPRDRFLSPSFVNAFKRYIGDQYAFGSTPVLSNWPASPSGEAIAEYTVRNVVYPYGAPFTITSTGPSLSILEQATGASLTGFQLRLQNGNAAGTSAHEISFNFTGDTFTFCFAVDPTGDGCDYELYVDNVLQGTYHTHRGLDGLTAGNDRRRVHKFGYVRNKQVRIKAIRLAGSEVTNTLRPEAIILDKVIRITNQGINGATTVSYRTYNLAGNTFGDGVAIGPEDGFVFCQLGTNDRISSAARPKSVEFFKNNLGLVIDSVAGSADVILMCANPAHNEDPTTYFMNMQAVRGVIYRTAKERGIDMVDNYSIFAGLDINVATSDGLHPNPLGAQMIARNILNALESSA